VTDVEQIAARLDVLEKRVAVAEQEREAYRKLYIETMERCRKLELGLLASKSEHLPDPGPQLSLDVLSMVLDERKRAELEAALAAANAEQEIPAHTRRKPTGRKPLPEHLPRVEIKVLPPEVEKEGRDAFERIGEDVCETIERRPASLVVARVVRQKFVRKDGERDGETDVLIAEPLELPIPRGLAGPGMLADTIVKRWQDHLPLHRLEDVYARDGLELARSTMCGWHAALADVVAPLLAAMRVDAFKQPYLCLDATGVLVQQKERCRTGHFWVLVAPGRHVLFEFTRAALGHNDRRAPAAAHIDRHEALRRSRQPLTPPEQSLRHDAYRRPNAVRLSPLASHAARTSWASSSVHLPRVEPSSDARRSDAVLPIALSWRREDAASAGHPRRSPSPRQGTGWRIDTHAPTMSGAPDSVRTSLAVRLQRVPAAAAYAKASPSCALPA
jgi:transposase